MRPLNFYNRSFCVIEVSTMSKWNFGNTRVHTYLCIYAIRLQKHWSPKLHSNLKSLECKTNTSNLCVATALQIIAISWREMQYPVQHKLFVLFLYQFFIFSFILILSTAWWLYCSFSLSLSQLSFNFSLLIGL